MQNHLQKFIFIIVLTFLSSTGFAQFEGGISDGFANIRVGDTCHFAAYTPFAGGISDGFAHARLGDSCSFTAFTPFAGGISDGFANARLGDTCQFIAFTPFAGGISDGFANARLGDTCSFTTFSPFLGGISDGFSNIRYGDSCQYIVPCSDTTLQSIELCFGESLTVGTNTYSISGDYTDVLTNQDGCDSIVITNLTVMPQITGVDTQIACHSFTWIDGNTYTSSNNTATHTIVGGAVNGCDSIVSLDLTIHDVVYGTDTQIACHSFTWIDGNTYTSSNNTATHTIVGGAVNGCDSIVSLDLTIHDVVYGTDTQIACHSFTWIDGNTYTSSNNTATHTIVGGAVNGCDSIVSLDLTIHDVVYGTDTQIACHSFTWIDGNTYTSSNNTATHTIVGGAVNGCDSIVSLDLTIHDVVYGTDTQIACHSFTWIDGNTYTSSNNTATHTIVGGAVNGCDSIVSLDLTIHDVVYGTDTQIACHSFTWIDGNTYTSSNNTATHTIVGGAVNGCDSIVSLDLTIHDVVYGTDTQIACHSFTWIDGNTYTSSNNTATHTIVGGAVNGCDSIVSLDLTIHDVVYGTDTQIACHSFTWIDGNTYTSSNNTATHTIVGGAVNGCDSIVSLDLTIHDVVYGTDTQIACYSFSWIDGNTYTSSNNTATYTIVGGAVNGCDSIVSLDLTIHDVVYGTDTQIACNSFTWIDGNTYTSSNNTATYTIVGGAVNGCDSIVSLDLTIHDVVYGTDTQIACHSFTWIDGNTYTSSNNTATHTIVGGAVNGCYSIVSLDLTIHDLVYGTDTIIACHSFTWIDGNTYTSSNNTATHTIVGGAVNGCDSIVSLDLTIHDVVYGTDTQIACHSFTWIDGNTYTSSNNTATHTIVGGAVNGCDSIVSLDLTIHDVVYGTDTQIACHSFTWIDGNTYTSSNNTATHTIVGGAVNGCDSIVSLDLTIHDVVYGTDTQIACHSFTWIDGNTYTSSNNTATHTIVGGAVNGCDSIVSLDLTIHDVVYGTDTQIACHSFTWIDGNTYTSSNNTATHTIVGGAVNGCDSIVSLDLTIHDVVYGTDTQIACHSFTWIDGNTYTSSNNTATHTIVGGAVNGCDSIVSLDLTIHDVVYGTDTQIACYSFSWIDGNTYTSSNNTATYTIVGGAVNGCDSIVSLDLTIHDVVYGTDTQIACNSFTWIDGNTYTSSNNTATYTIVGGAVNGCDSIVSLDLTIHDVVYGTDTQIACHSFTWIDGNTYTSSNNTATHTIVGGAVNGCYSIVSLDLTIHDLVYGTDTIIACHSFTWIDGNTYTSSNNTATHTIVGGAVNGCDSIVSLDLTIHDVVYGTDTQIACHSFTWIDGNTYTSSNNTATHTIVGGAVNGCDSIVSLDLTIHDVVYGTDTQIACHSFTWIDGNTYTSSNNTATHTIVGGAVNGCDSIVSLDLTIHDVVYGTDTQIACHSFTWIDGNTYTSSNNTATHTIVGGAVNGCDSIVSLDLTIHDVVYGTDTQIACHSFTWIDGNTYTSSNNTATHTIVGGAVNGCDSIVSLDLTIHDVVYGTDTQIACHSFTWIDGNTYTSSNNTATHTIVGGAVNGCDSIVSLDLTIHDVVYGTDTQIACHSFTWIDGNTYTSSNNTATHTIVGGAVNGCDSIVSLDLTIHDVVYGTDTQIACHSFTWIDGNTYTSSNNTATHTIVGGAVNGCDSIVSLDLTIHDVVYGTDTQIACHSFTWIDGNTYTSSNNTATHTIVGGAVNGCDSIVSLDLTIHDVVYGTDTQIACHSFTWIDGNTYTSSNNTATHTIVGGAVNGCDSIVSLDLTIHDVVYGTDTQIACHSFTWIDGNTYTSSNNTATHTIVGGAVNGCDSIVSLDLTIHDVVYGTDTQIACYSFSWIDGNTYTSSNNTATYTIVGGAVNGCDSIVSLDLTIHDVVYGTDTQIACHSFTWIDGNTYTSSNNTATYTIVGGAVNGCDSIVSLDLTIHDVVYGTDTQIA